MVQLWVNLPAKHKMVAPGYQGITSDDIPAVALPGNAGTARVIAGEYEGARGPARTFTPMNVWDLRLTAGHSVAFELPAGHTASLFVLRGAVQVGGHRVGEAELAVMERAGSTFAFDIAEDTVALLLAGEPIDEPVVGRGPFVMNTVDEIAQAIADLRSGRFGHLDA